MRYRDRKIYCLQVRLCIVQPGNFTGLCNEGVKRTRLLMERVDQDGDSGCWDLPYVSDRVVVSNQ